MSLNRRDEIKQFQAKKCPKMVKIYPRLSVPDEISVFWAQNFTQLSTENPQGFKRRRRVVTFLRSLAACRRT